MNPYEKHFCIVLAIMIVCIIWVGPLFLTVVMSGLEGLWPKWTMVPASVWCAWYVWYVWAVHKFVGNVEETMEEKLDVED